jgi:ribosomal protein S18 acetylase RimI-like enzyme
MMTVTHRIMKRAATSLDRVAALETVPADEAVFFQLYTAVRTEELGMQDWDPEVRSQILRFQFEAQRRAHREHFPGMDECLILRDGSPVGWVIVDRSGTELHGIDMALLPGERDKGVGTRVIRALQEEAAVRNLPMAIAVLRSNGRALGLYVRLGFRVVGESDTHILMDWRR